MSAIRWREDDPKVLKMDSSDGYYRPGTTKGGTTVCACAFMEQPPTAPIAREWQSVSMVEGWPVKAAPGWSTWEAAMDAAMRHLESWAAHWGKP